MKKFRLLLMAMLAITSVQCVQAAAVGDRFKADGTTYQITSIAAGNYTVGIYDTDLRTSAITFPGEVADSIGTTFKVTSVLANAFNSLNGSKAVETMTFSEGLLRVESWGFNRAHLTTINLPKSLEYWAEGAYEMNNLEMIAVNVTPGGAFKSVDGVLYSADGTILYFYPNGKTATEWSIPEGVTTIRGEAIRRSETLTKITIPASCTYFTPKAFYCPALTNLVVASGNPSYKIVDGMLCDITGETLVYLPQGLTGDITNSTFKTIGSYAFYGSKGKKVTLSAVETVKTHAFFWDGTREINLGASFKTAENEFIWHTSVTQLSISDENPYFSSDESGVLYNKDYTVLIAFPTALALTNYKTHANTKIIKAAAFTWCERLTQITISNNVEEIQHTAFYACTRLASVIFEKTSKLKWVGSEAFSNNEALKNITFPASLESIGNNAFVSNRTVGPQIQSVYFESGSKLSSIGYQAFRDCTELETFEFLGTHTADSLSFGERVFAGCSKLVGNSEGTFFMPAAVWHIGESAFNGCSSLTSVTFQQTSTKQPKLERIGFAAFQNSGLLSITLPKSVKHVGNEAFNSCWQLKTVSIPAATEYVGPQAFLFCSGLKEILVDKQNTTYSSVDGMLASKDKKILYTFPAGKAATYYTMLSPSFETINDSAFYYNRQLRSVTIPKKVTRIGAHAFALCPNLERINFLADNPITDVHAEAFIDMERVSQLPNIDLYVRNGHKGAYQSSSFWNKAKSINESFIASGSELGRVEFFPMSPTDVSIVAVNNSSTSEDMTTFVVPEKVTQGGSTYNVKLIGDYAFEGSDTNIDEVVVPSSVELNYVGARAFVKGNSSPAIKSIFLVNSARPELATSAFGLHDAGVTDNYDEVADGQTIYVKESAESAFKTAWNTMADKITYQIPLPMANTFSTFAREFDADFSEFSVNNTSTAKPGWPKVVAFTAGEYRTDGKDSEGNPMNYIIMESINCDASGNIGTEGDGTYIPAGTGVLLKAIDGSGSASDFYYQIYDKNDEDLPSYTAENLLRGITRSTKEVQPTEGDKTNFIVSGNQLHKMTFARWIPAHKSYLQVPTSLLPTASGAKLAFYFRGLEDFDIDDVVTAIDNGQLTIDNSANDDGEVYDLQGRRVAAPQKGIYVKNGKKVIIK